jgi:hypothetical protein
MNPEAMAFRPLCHSPVAIAKPCSAVSRSALVRRLLMWPQSSPSAACKPISNFSRSRCG